MEEGMIGSCGESAHPLESKNWVYLAVSPVMDNFEQLDREAVEDLLIPISKLKFEGEQGFGSSLMSIGGACHEELSKLFTDVYQWYSLSKMKIVLQMIGQNWLYANQPQNST